MSNRTAHYNGKRVNAAATWWPSTKGLSFGVFLNPSLERDDEQPWWQGEDTIPWSVTVHLALIVLNCSISFSPDHGD